MTIQEILDERGVVYASEGQHHHCRPGWVQLEVCPFCNSTNYHLGYNIELGYFNCWRCGGHHVLRVLEAIGLQRREAKALLQDLDISTTLFSREEKRRINLVEPEGRGPLQQAHKRYLLSRGFNPNRLERLWKLEGIATSARLSWRIYIPIYYQTQRVSWTTRAIGHNVVRRYVSASPDEESAPHKHLIYGMDFCLHSIIVVEGPTDAWRVGPGAGATFGTSYTAQQVKALAAFPLRVVCFDTSPTAQGVAGKLVRDLSCFPGETKNVVLDAEDPGSASSKEINLLRREAKL